MDRLAAVEDESTSTGTVTLARRGSRFRRHLSVPMKIQGKADLSSNLQENPSVQVETSDDVAANLDPTEQKLLFGMDDGHCLEVPLGGSLDACSGNSLCGSSLENIHFGAIPSMQSGSWSTLTQEALQACSNDKGIQEGWSGLSFQKMEHPVVMDSVVSNDNAKRPSTWDDGYLPTPLVSFQLSAGENNYKQFHQVQKQKPILEGSPQAQIPLINEVWVDQSYEQCANDSVDMQYTEGSCTYQQTEALVNFPQEFSDTPNFWNSSCTMATGGDCVSDVCDNDVNMGKPGGSNMHVNSGEQPVESDIGSSVQAEVFAVDNYGSVVNTNNFDSKIKEAEKHNYRASAMAQGQQRLRSIRWGFQLYSHNYYKKT
ncbi:hypothetical protein BHM03_00041842 [Ensete ventricosum]|nr:hypothetical protein BHM03_00041842 [Ensete ventricosum]